MEIQWVVMVVFRSLLCGIMSLMNGVLADEVQDLTEEVPCRENEISTRDQVREHAKERETERLGDTSTITFLQQVS